MVHVPAGFLHRGRARRASWGCTCERGGFGWFDLLAELVGRLPRNAVVAAGSGLLAGFGCCLIFVGLVFGALLDELPGGPNCQVSMRAAAVDFQTLGEAFGSVQEAGEVLQLHWVRGRGAATAVLLGVEDDTFIMAVPALFVKALVEGPAEGREAAGVLGAIPASARLVGSDGHPYSEATCELLIVELSADAVAEFTEFRAAQRAAMRFNNGVADAWPFAPDLDRRRDGDRWSWAPAAGLAGRRGRFCFGRSMDIALGPSLPSRCRSRAQLGWLLTGLEEPPSLWRRRQERLRKQRALEPGVKAEKEWPQALLTRATRHLEGGPFADNQFTLQELVAELHSGMSCVNFGLARGLQVALARVATVRLQISGLVRSCDFRLF